MGSCHTLFPTKMVEIDTLFQTKTAKKNILFGAAHTYSLNKGLPKSLLFENVFSVAWITMSNKIFTVTAQKYREKSTHPAG